MLTQLCQRIRALTLQAEELVDKKQVEQCLALLVERQNLLDQLKHQFLSCESDPNLSATFTALLRWIQQQDAVNNAKVMALRDQSLQDSVTQIKIKKALHHYKNIT